MKLLALLIGCIGIGYVLGRLRGPLKIGKR